MELTDILSLVKAGYTRAEIEQMEKPIDPTPVPVAEPVHAEAPAPVAQPVPQPAQQPEQVTMAELMQSMAKLTSAIQANAIAQSVIPSGISNPPKAEDMLAEIIRPTFKERS